MNHQRLLLQGLFCAFSLFSSTYIHAQWQYVGTPESCHPIGMDLEGDTLILLTSSGLFYSTDISGAWTSIALPLTSYALKNVTLENGSLYLQTEHHETDTQEWSNTIHTIHRSDDWGVKWTDISTLSDPTLYLKALAVKSDTLYLIGDDRIYISYDRGDTYVAERPSPANFQNYTIHHHALYASKLSSPSSSTLFCSKDDGLTWDTIYTCGPDQTIKSIASLGGQLWKMERIHTQEDAVMITTSHTQGASWIQLDTLYNVTGGFNSISGLYGQPDDLYLLTDWSNPLLLRSIDGGFNWNEVGMWAQYDDLFYAHGNIFKLTQHGVEVSENHGLTFTTTSKGINGATVEDLTFVNHTLWGQANFGLHSTSDDGTTWHTSQDFNAIAKTKDGHLLATIQGIPHRSDDSGESWIVIPPGAFNLPVYYPIISLACVENLMYIFTPSHIYYSVDYGITWTLSDQVLGQSIVYNGKYLLLTRDRSVATSDNGIDWVTLPPVGTPNQIPSIDNVYWLEPYYYISDDQLIMRLHQDSSEWVNVSIDLPGTIDVFPVQHHIPVVSFSSKDNILLASYYNYGVFASRDFGKTWFDMNTGLSNFRTIKLEKNNTDLYLCVDGGIWRRPLGELAQFQHSGFVFSDKNANGLYDESEPGVPNVPLTKLNQGHHTNSVWDGSFVFISDSDAEDFIVLHSPSVYASVTTPSIPVSASSDSIYAGLYFIPGIYDASVFITNNRPFRPGFETIITITYKNNGTETTDLDIKLAFPQELEYQSSSPEATFQGDTLTWIINDVSPVGSGKITVVVKPDASVAIGTSILLYAFTDVTNDGDANLVDNEAYLNVVVVGAYDPNDKAVFPSGYITPAMIADTQRLEYTIRFQNTGNYPATFVRIQDTLSTFLDLTSLEIIAASHDYTWRLLPDNVLDFYFDNINLPDSTNDERGSHGFVKFAINAKTSLQLADKIENKAYIYFDYNVPVITNTVGSTVGFETSIKEPNKRLTLTASPNPTKDFIMVTISDQVANGEVVLTLYDANGAFVKTQSSSSLENIRMDMQGLPSGMYLLQARTSEGTGVVKVVKN